MESADKLTLLPRAEPFFHLGNRIGCLCIHGFTGAPQEMRELGERLAARGYTVYAPRLTHHGTYPADMIRSQWHDWYFAALDGYHMLSAHCEQVIPIGLSMGGATALLLAAWEPVTAVVSLAAPIHLRDDPRMGYTRQIASIYPFDPPLEPDWREQFDPDGRISYPVNPIRAVAELRDYLQVVEEHLSQVTVPALLMHAVDDETVPPLNMGKIYQRLGSEIKTRHILNQGGHVLTEGVEKEHVFKTVLDFVHRHAAQEAGGTSPSS